MSAPIPRPPLFDQDQELSDDCEDPHGDSEMGQAEARSAANRRRVVTGFGPVDESAEESDQKTTVAGPPEKTPTTDAVPEQIDAGPATFLRRARRLAFGVVGALALRGLRSIGRWNR